MCTLVCCIVVCLSSASSENEQFKQWAINTETKQFQLRNVKRNRVNTAQRAVLFHNLVTTVKIQHDSDY